MIWLWSFFSVTVISPVSENNDIVTTQQTDNYCFSQYYNDTAAFFQKFEGEQK